MKLLCYLQDVTQHQFFELSTTGFPSLIPVAIPTSKDPTLSYNLPIGETRIVGLLIPFARVLV